MNAIAEIIHSSLSRLHPLLYYTICLILGIWWKTTAYPWFIGLIIPIAMAWLLLYLYNHQSFLITLFPFVFFITGSCSYALHKHRYTIFHQQFDKKTCDIIGTIVDIEPSTNRRFKHIITVDADSIIHDCKYHNVGARIKIYTPSSINAQPYDTIHIYNVAFPRQTLNDFNRYLMKEGIYSVIFDTLEYKVIGHQRSIASHLYNTRKRIRNACYRKMSPNTFTLFTMLFLGNKSSDIVMITSLREQFKLWGLSHYLARSGLHLVIFLMIMQLLLRLLPLSFLLKQLMLMSSVLVYAVLSWSSISFMRSLLMILLYHICNVLILPINALHILSLVTCLILIPSPMQLFFLDFQLSFALTCALALLIHVNYGLK